MVDSSVNRTDAFHLFDLGALGDFNGLKDLNPGLDTRRVDRITVPDMSGDTAASCTTLTECGGRLCVGGRCGDFPTSCGQIHSAETTLGDGEYSLRGGDGGILVAYCDMQLGQELCTTVEGQHEGKTRDGASLAFLMTSKLTDAGNCEIWAVRGMADGYPLDRLRANTVLPDPKPCQALGFKADDTLGACNFGSNQYVGASTCGFPAAVGSFYRYGNHCDAGCTKNSGEFTYWVLQGEMFSAAVMSTMDGSVRTVCKTR